jgi:hypothetical protein
VDERGDRPDRTFGDGGALHTSGRRWRSSNEAPISVTGAVTLVGDAEHMAADVPPLQLEMLLKCSRCGRWHEVRLDNEHAGETPHAREMLYWWCGSSRFYAGQMGSRSRHPIRFRSVLADITRDDGE